MGRNNADFRGATMPAGSNDANVVTSSTKGSLPVNKRGRVVRTKDELKKQERQENDSSAERYYELRGE